MTDGPGNYDNRERCEVKALQPLLLTAEQYDIERGYDYVTVDGVRFSDGSAGRLGPQAMVMNTGEKWVWTSDNFLSRGGYKLCAKITKQSTDKTPTTGMYASPRNVMCVCMCICVRVCMHACMHVCMYVCMHVWMTVLLDALLY